MYSCRNEQESCVRALYSAGCDTNLRFRGKTALYYLKEKAIVGRTKDDIIWRRIVRILEGENVPLMVSENSVMNKERADLPDVTKAAFDGRLVDFLDTNKVSVDVLSEFLTQEKTFALENVLQVDHIILS